MSKRYRFRVTANYKSPPKDTSISTWGSESLLEVSDVKGTTYLSGT